MWFPDVRVFCLAGIEYCRKLLSLLCFGPGPSLASTSSKLFNSRCIMEINLHNPAQAGCMQWTDRKAV